jgi:hypothetical protein
MLAAYHLHHISYNVDGVSIERGLTHDLFHEALESGHLLPPPHCIEAWLSSHISLH